MWLSLVTCSSWSKSVYFCMLRCDTVHLLTHLSPVSLYTEAHTCTQSHILFNAWAFVLKGFPGVSCGLWGQRTKVWPLCWDPSLQGGMGFLRPHSNHFPSVSCCEHNDWTTFHLVLCRFNMTDTNMAFYPLLHISSDIDCSTIWLKSEVIVVCVAFLSGYGIIHWVELLVTRVT